MTDNHSSLYLNYIGEISKKINKSEIQQMVLAIRNIRNKKGRIFFIGVGGSAGNCSHAVNDFRKLCNIECYTPTDNVSELTARINDDGWDDCFVEWLKVSRISNKDLIFVMSVGGGNLRKKVSVNIINAIKYAKKQNTKIVGIVGRSDGFTRKNANISVLVPTVNKNLVTPLTESFQAIIWHCLVSHPLLQKNKTKW